MASRDPAITSRIMSAVRSKDTGPELMLRRALHRRGLRYRLHTSLPGRPDIVFAAARVAVFVDGDFWHGQGWRERGFDSFEAQFEGHKNPDKWRAKIARNVARDEAVTRALEAEGWYVVRCWESAIRRDVHAIADSVAAVIRERSSAGS